MTARIARGVPPASYDLSIGKAAEYVGVDRATLRRWHVRGAKTAHGRVKLDMLRKGGAYWTSLAAVEDFLAACNPVAGEAGGEMREPGQPRPLTAGEAARLEAGLAKLRERGLKV